MLILTRNVNEIIMIGDDIVVTVLSIKSNQVRIGIQAPICVPVHREEIYRRLQLEKIKNMDKRFHQIANNHGIGA